MASLEVFCPLGHRLQITEAQFHQTVNCPTCNTPIVVPDLGTAASVPPLPFIGSPVIAPAKPQGGRAMREWLTVKDEGGILGGIATVVLVGVIAVASISGCGEMRGGRGKRPITDAIHVSIRPSLVNSATGVLQLRNGTNRALTVLLQMHNKNSNQRTAHQVEIGPYTTEEIGVLEAGWAFEPNETVEISSTGFDSVTYKTFKTDSGTVGITKAWW